MRHERAMSESAAHGESTWTRKRTTAEGLMGRFWTFYSKVAQAGQFRVGQVFSKRASTIEGGWVGGCTGARAEGCAM